MPRTGDETTLTDGYFEGRKGHAVALKDGDKVPEGAIRINRAVVAQMRQEKIMNLPLSEK